jgi:CSLREA domain-containing protein
VRTTISLRVWVLLAATVGALLLVGVLFFYNSSLALAQSIGTAAAPGTTIKVNTKADEDNTDGDCSLRQAIEAANTNSGVDGCAAGSATERDAIHFALGKQATITLTSQLPLITDSAGLTINGQKAKSTVSGNDSVPVFVVFPGAKLNLKSRARLISPVNTTHDIL